MFIQITILLAGLALVVFGADWLVDGASAIARRLGISEFVIGLTIVGFGTSCPELVVSLNGALSGSSDIAIGNVIGSNIFNSLLILGVTSLISPIVITRSNVRRDIPICIAVTLLLLILGMPDTLFGIGENIISRLDAFIFIIVFILYLVFCFKTDRTAPRDDESVKQIKLPVAVAIAFAGLAGLIAGGRLFVDAATKIAGMLGVSDKFIAITILAGGTSMPELATCVVAAFKKKGQLALGNILGSNVFNILLILGCSGLVYPINLGNINLVDIAVLAVSAVILLTASFTGRKNLIDRFDAVLMLLCEAAYLCWLFLTA